MPRKSSATARCPHPGHAGSRVHFDGRYGKPPHRRQRYKCVPANGDRPHVFTEALPREEAWLDACDICERPVESREGPHAARRYQFVARGISGALLTVGAGGTYRQAALVARERAQRLPVDPQTGDVRYSRHGQLVMDWVEVFAPVVFEPHRPTEWPSTGTLLLDDIPFRVRNRATGRTLVAFRIFCAAGYGLDDQLRIWRLQAFTTKSQRDWTTFLRSLPGAPPRVVCDNDYGMVNAVRGVFPQADLYLCEWHLRKALVRLMNKVADDEPQHRAAITQLLPRVEPAFTGAAFWRPFVRDAHQAGIPRVSDWLNSTGRIVEQQFRRRGLRTNRPATMPLTTSPMDDLLHGVRDSIAPRAYALKNRKRTDRLLLLMQLHANRLDHDRAYTKTIREWLEANGGRPRTPRRAVADRGRPSLRR